MKHAHRTLTAHSANLISAAPYLIGNSVAGPVFAISTRTAIAPPRVAFALLGELGLLAADRHAEVRSALANYYAPNLTRAAHLFHTGIVAGSMFALPIDVQRTIFFQLIEHIRAVGSATGLETLFLTGWQTVWTTLDSSMLRVAAHLWTDTVRHGDIARKYGVSVIDRLTDSVYDLPTSIVADDGRIVIPSDPWARSGVGWTPGVPADFGGNTGRGGFGVSEPQGGLGGQGSLGGPNGPLGAIINGLAAREGKWSDALGKVGTGLLAAGGVSIAGGAAIGTIGGAPQAGAALAGVGVAIGVWGLGFVAAGAVVGLVEGSGSGSSGSGPAGSGSGSDSGGGSGSGSGASSGSGSGSGSGGDSGSGSGSGSGGDSGSGSGSGSGEGASGSGGDGSGSGDGSGGGSGSGSYPTPDGPEGFPNPDDPLGHRSYFPRPDDWYPAPDSAGGGGPAGVVGIVEVSSLTLAGRGLNGFMVKAANGVVAIPSAFSSIGPNGASRGGVFSQLLASAR